MDDKRVTDSSFVVLGIVEISYIFSHENRLAEYDKDEIKLEILKVEYMDILNRLEMLQQAGVISVYKVETIIEMSNKVLDNFAKKYENVMEGVKSVMGGRILEYEAKAIKREGILYFIGWT